MRHQKSKREQNDVIFKHGSIYIRNKFPGNPEIVNWKTRGNWQVRSGKSCRADRLFPSTDSQAGCTVRSQSQAKRREWSTDSCLLAQNWWQHAKFPQDKMQTRPESACWNVVKFMDTWVPILSTPASAWEDATQKHISFPLLVCSKTSSQRSATWNASIFLCFFQQGFPLGLVDLSLNRACCFFGSWWWFTGISVFPSCSHPFLLSQERLPHKVCYLSCLAYRCYG